MQIQINGVVQACKRRTHNPTNDGWSEFYVMQDGLRVSRHSVPSAALSVGGAFITSGNLYKVLSL